MIPQEINDAYDVAKLRVSPARREIPEWNVLLEYYNGYNEPLQFDGAVTNYLAVLRYVEKQMEQP